MKNIKEILYWQVYYKMLLLCVRLFYYLPVKRHKIVMSHDGGGSYGDSPKILAEEILRRGLPYEIVWLVNSNDQKVPAPIRPSMVSRIRSVYDLATAKVIVTTGKYGMHLRKKKNQFFVYVPHGQIGAKYVERQAGNTLGEGYIKGSKWHSSVSDLFISSSKMHTKEMLTWYWYSGPVMECGLPRNDIFFHYSADDVKRIRQKVGIPDGMKVCFYAPTFRNEPGTNPYDIDVNRLLDTLQQKTGETWVFMFRAHPCFIYYGKLLFKTSDRIFDETLYPDMQELLLMSDILISDYSSTMFDFNLMHRPVFLYTKDIEAYQKMRGLKDWYFKVPFPFCHNNDELMQAVLDFNEEKYHKSCEEFDKFYGSVDDGNGSKKIVDLFEKVMK